MTTIKHGFVVFRLWDEKRGLSETTWKFHTLEELYDLCLRHGESLLVDRIVIEGNDEADIARTLTLAFQSVSLSQREE